MRFVKYRIELVDKKEDDFVTEFDGNGSWEGIKEHADRYGILSFGLTNKDNMCVEGMIEAHTASECKGLYNGLKDWLKREYKCKVSEMLVASGGR